MDGSRFSREDEPNTADPAIPSRFDRATGVTSGAPPQFVGLTIIRTTAKATINHYRPGLAGRRSPVEAGGQVERGEHHVANLHPNRVRYLDISGRPSIRFEPIRPTSAVSRSRPRRSRATPSRWGRLTINAGVRFDHSRAISQDLHAVDAEGRETDQIGGPRDAVHLEIVSPRLGVTVKLTADGRTIGRAS